MAVYSSLDFCEHQLHGYCRVPGHLPFHTLTVLFYEVCSMERRHHIHVEFFDWISVSSKHTAFNLHFKLLWNWAMFSNYIAKNFTSFLCSFQSKYFCHGMDLACNTLVPVLKYGASQSTHGKAGNGLSSVNLLLRQSPETLDC